MAEIDLEARDLGYSLPANLRWLAEQSDRPGYVPCGMLTGAFLIECANRMDWLSQKLTETRARLMEGEGE